MNQTTYLQGNVTLAHPTTSIHHNSSSILHKILKPFTPRPTNIEQKSNSPVVNQSCLVKYALNHTHLRMDICDCPHVLIADDDSFQHFFYQSLFQRSLDFTDIPIKREQMKLAIHFSGEELINHFEKIKNCGCDKVVLVITDYNMGINKLNGVDTSSKLRQAGYNGKIVMRSSEPKESLVSYHENLEVLLKDQTINVILDKVNIKPSKEVIQDYLAEAMRMRNKLEI